MSDLRQKLIDSIRMEERKQIRARDLGNGPHRDFGAALPARHRGTFEVPMPITERPIRLRGTRCPVCGESRFYCPEHEGDDE